ncbi:MAG: plastocyanin/azurin family copper-binding protein, partial [Pirellulales bacterium]
MATTARQGVLREIGLVSLINVDKSADGAWQLANRSAASLGDLLAAMPLVADGSLRASLYERIVPLVSGKGESLSAAGTDDPAASLRHAAMTALTHVRGQEAKTFELLAPLVALDRDRLAAIRALKRIARTDWPKEQARPLLDNVVAYLAKVPVEERTTPAALDAMEFAHALAGLLPADDARRARAKLSDLGVRVIRLGTLFERMSYDQDVIAMAAGKPVEIVFENYDLMPHNFVIVRPGSLEEIGTAAEATAQQPGVAERHYVPASPNVLLGSTLLQPRDSQKLSFVAPAEPGVYPYVCTYPGHWRRMYGALYVVEDLDAYL